MPHFPNHQKPPRPIRHRPILNQNFFKKQINNNKPHVHPQVIPKLTAAGPGPSGLRIKHFIDAVEVPLLIPLLQSLKAVINLLTSGNAPKELAVYLAGGIVTALNKANSGVIHRIAVGEVLCCLAGKCLCAALK